MGNDTALLGNYNTALMIGAQDRQSPADSDDTRDRIYTIMKWTS